MGESSRTPTRRAELADDLRCPQCGYDLRALTSERCPECAFPVELIRALGYQIPWVHRRRIGFLRAYWRTALAVTFRGKRFFGNAPQRVDYCDARRFYWITVAVFYVSLLVLFGGYVAANGSFRAAVGVNAWFVAVILVAALLGTLAMTGLPSYFFHPRRLTVAEQNRAVAVSYYACAPLVWISVALVPFAAWVAAHLKHGTKLDMSPWSAIVVAIVAAALWWKNLLHASRKIVRRTPMSTLRLAILIPLLWLVVGGLIIVGLPAIIFYVVALVYALR